jgi:apolipoprotein D and lipocalin family protein
LITKGLIIFLAAASLLAFTGCTHVKPANPPEVVPWVDLARYSGVWYEIARFPNSFQKGCLDSKATYTLDENGKIDVLNECAREGKPGKAKGKARVADKETNAKLEVSFFWPFYGDYWIIELAPDYSYAVVSEPRRRYLWLLAREKTMPDKLYGEILSNLEKRGFDISALIKNPD